MVYQQSYQDYDACETTMQTMLLEWLNFNFLAHNNALLATDIISLEPAPADAETTFEFVKDMPLDSFVGHRNDIGLSRAKFTYRDLAGQVQSATISCSVAQCRTKAETFAQYALHLTVGEEMTFRQILNEYLVKNNAERVGSILYVSSRPDGNRRDYKILSIYFQLDNGQIECITIRYPVTTPADILQAYCEQANQS